jgi:leader peptidase (prepilin peptidase)/N-methyltransferase
MWDDVAALYSSDPALFAGSVFLLGLIVGSFLNVVIYRLPIILERQWRFQASELLSAEGASGSAPTPTVPAPLERFTLITPRSACPHCKAPISAWQNIPVISWLILRGRCAACGARISVRYPLVELATGAMSACVAWHFGFGWPAFCALILTWSLIALAVIDLDHQLLPDDITLPLMWGGLLAAAAIGSSAGASIPVSLHSAVIGAACGYLSLWLVFHVFRLITGKEGMGYGDFKLFAALGAWLGWKMLPLVILLSAASGAILGILLIAFRGRDRAAPIPFGPYLAAAGWVALIYGDRLVHGYLAVSGLTRP